MNIFNRQWLIPCIITALLPLLSACGGSSGYGTSSSYGSNGTMSVAMTDAPSCGFDHVYITVDRVRVNQSATAENTDSGWVEVALIPSRKIDLLSLTNGILTTLGQTSLKAGHYEQIRLLLVSNQGNTLNNSIVVSGSSTEQAMSTPSATQSGYKVIGSFDVQANTLVDLVLDFDACHSIVQQGNGSFALKPVVTATPEVVSGSIVGYVAASGAGASVYAEQSGVIQKTTFADSTGKFVLSPLMQSSTNGTYDIVMTQSLHASAILRSVPVTAGNSTTVSTSSAPFMLSASAMHNASGVVVPASANATIDALQSSGGGSFDIAYTNANLDTGVYSLSLPSAAPMVGSYSSMLPISLTADAAAAGKYTLKATSSSGSMLATGIDVSSSDANNINFNF